MISAWTVIAIDGVKKMTRGGRFASSLGDGDVMVATAVLVIGGSGRFFGVGHVSLSLFSGQ